MPRVSEEALEKALKQLAEHAGDSKHRSNWMSTFLAACRVQAARYPNTISGVDRAVDDLFVLLPHNPTHGRINPFVRSGSGKWLKIADSGRSTVWNTGTRRGKQTVLFVDNHFKNGLLPNALSVLLESLGRVKLPGRDALAVFLARNHDWKSEPEKEELHEVAADVIGLAVQDFMRITSASSFIQPFLGEPEWTPDLLASSDLGPALFASEEADQGKNPDLFHGQETERASTSRSGIRLESRPQEDEQQSDGKSESLAWTEDICHHTLRDVHIETLAAQVLRRLDSEYIVLPDPERLVRRCVTALLVGNLVLQGPPGTGKTTLARFLADAFEVDLIQTTATSEWSPYQVVGGFRPSGDGKLTQTHGVVTAAAVDCAITVRQDLAEDLSPAEDVEGSSAGFQATWLFIDEFNRADIDKAIGSLFTVLSSSDPRHLAKTPIDLWFEPQENRKKLWLPSRFRIIAAMNDLDTSFVNQMSQGLTRRFQFVTVGVPDERPSENAPITRELRHALAAAQEWLAKTYGSVLVVPPLNVVDQEFGGVLARLQAVIDGVRHPDQGAGWPVGTAQVLDVLRVVLLRWVSDHKDDVVAMMDDAVADRLVPQMAGVGDEAEFFTQLFERLQFRIAAEALRHLVDPHRVP
ncbi:AAA family ATPase [Saccharothrix lopnurensis]|uniref:AAA family ATPase n=1 Tax=Saccharothrix lopnurensis TaxID=1670621 RepID=A0ABW1NYV8_9PSEU